MNMHTNLKLRLLEIIKQYNLIAIKDIARLSAQSIPNATRYIDEMIESGVLQEYINNVVVTGRHPKLVGLNPDYGYIVCVDLGRVNSASIGIFNFSSQRIAHKIIGFNAENTAEQIIENIMQETEGLISALSSNRGKLLNIIIGNPGVVDPETGSIKMFAPSAKWYMLPLKTIFGNRFNTEVVVLNDINLSAVGEKEHGLGRGYRNFIFVRGDAGLKAGIIIKNRLYQGETGSAGEIGYNVILGNDTGKRNIISAESLLSMSSILSRVADQLPAHPNDMFFSITHGNKNNVSVENILKVLDSDSYVSDIIRNCGEIFAYVLLNIVTTLDISLVIIGGEIIKLHNYFFKPLREVLSESMSNPPTVITSSLGADAALYGAFSIGLEQAFKQIK